MGDLRLSLKRSLICIPRKLLALISFIAVKPESFKRSLAIIASTSNPFLLVNDVLSIEVLKNVLFNDYNSCLFRCVFHKIICEKDTAWNWNRIKCLECIKKLFYCGREGGMREENVCTFTWCDWPIRIAIKISVKIGSRTNTLRFFILYHPSYSSDHSLYTEVW